jgi:hypothetical protein
MKAVAMAMLSFTLMAPVSQEKLPQGVIEGRVTRPGTNEGVAEAQITLAGPTPVFDRALLNGLYTPRSDLTPDMRDQIGRLIDTAPPGVAPATIANAALRLEASLLGLPAPATIPVTPTNAVSIPPPQSRTTATDADGGFSFKNLAPGRYLLRAQREGYFGLENAVSASFPMQVSTSVTVAADQPTSKIAINLLRGSVISGRLRDPNGRLATNLSVVAYQVTYSEGRSVLASVKTAQTDDRGDYRLFWMPPGDYLVAVNPRRPSATPTSQDAYARTFYPGLLDARYATPIVVNEGADISGIDLAVRAEATSRITGRIVSPLAGPNGKTFSLAASVLYLVSRDPNTLTDSAVVQMPNVAATKVNGEFEIRNVPPGSYDLLASASDSRGPVWGRARVDVGKRDVEDVAIAVQPNVEVRIRVTVDGAPPASTQVPAPRGNPARGAPESAATAQTTIRPSIQLRLQPRDIAGAPYEGSANAGMTFDPAGVFTFPGVAEGRYNLAVSGIPPNAYVEDVRMAGVSVYDQGLSITGGFSGEVEVLLSTRGALVSGNVADIEGKPVASARVALVPMQNRRDNLALYKSTVSNESGRFTINGILPGEYKLFAWESIPANAWMIADALAPYEQRGKAVTIATGTPASADLIIIPKSRP